MCSILADNKMVINRVYTSRLQRSVSTAYPLALELGVPLIVSSALSKTAAAVEIAEWDLSPFLFQTLENLRELCPGVDVIDGDQMGSAPQLVYEPKGHWSDPLKNIAMTDPISIVVAHRETIKNVMKKKFRVSYCAIGDFNFVPESEIFSLNSMYNRDGSEHEC